MRITIRSVGKAHDKVFSEAIHQYEARVRNRLTIAWQFIPGSTITEESAALQRGIPEGAYVIALDEGGSMLSSPQLADLLHSSQNNAIKDIVFLIGGAFGFDDSVRDRAQLVWSLSPLVFPHQLVRVILIEQLYRASDIMQGGKYHHA